MMHFTFFFVFIFNVNSIQILAQTPRSSQTSDLLDTLTLPEVIVTAKENQHISTSSILERSAIAHTQPFDLSNLMQLLPGGLTPKITLHDPQYFSIRSLFPNDHTNTLGSGIWIDGARISNNGNLQMRLFSAEHAEFGYRGIDTRFLSLEDIESVEIIRGIPSAQYGDITSGAVLIHTQTTLQPFTFNLKLTDAIKALQVGKGWKVGKQNLLNLSGSFTHTYEDPRSHEKLFRKINAQTFWKSNFRNISLNIRLSGSFTFESNEKEKDRLQGEFIKSRNHLITTNLYGTWLINRKWLTSLSYRINGSYSRQVDEQRRKHTNMESIGTNRTSPGEDSAFFIPSNYYSHANIEGVPINVSASIVGKLIRTGAISSSQSILGIEWDSEGNKGRGRVDDPFRPSNLWQRPRSYQELPFMHTFVFFIEEKRSIEGYAGMLRMENGLRFTRFSTHTNTFSLKIEPRLQFHYSPWHFFTIKAGWGRLYKTPSLAYLSPNPFYNDYISYRYNDPTTGNRLAVMTTDVIQPTTSKLSLPRNDKAEWGIITRLAGIEIDITGFYEHLHGGYTLQDGIRPSIHRLYHNDNQTNNIPTYTPAGVTVNGIPVSYTYDTTFVSYQNPSNARFQNKSGVEFVISPGKWKALASRVVIDGAYIRIQEHQKGFFIR